MKFLSRSTKNTPQPAWIATQGVFDADHRQIDNPVAMGEAVLAMHNEGVRHPDRESYIKTQEQEDLARMGEEVVKAAEIIVASEPNKPE